MQQKNIDLLGQLGQSSLSLASSQNLPAISLYDCKAVSIQLVYTGTPSGNWKLQVSNDLSAPSNWTDVANSSNTISAAGNLTYEVTDCTVEWLRAAYTATGAGTAPVLSSARAKVKS
jgi:hypothetical protein